MEAPLYFNFSNEHDWKEQITFHAKDVQNQNENPNKEHKENENPKDES